MVWALSQRWFLFIGIFHFSFFFLQVEVEFIDYGNTEIIHMVLIRKPLAVSQSVVTLPFQVLLHNSLYFSDFNFICEVL